MSENTKHHKILMFHQAWLRPELEKLGHQVVTAGFGADRGFDFTLPDSAIELSQLIERLPFEPDRLIVFDDSSLQQIFGFESVNLPTVFYSVDTHHHSTWHRYFSALCSLTLVAQRQHIPELESVSQNVRWFPVWPLVLPTPAEKKEVIAVFRGTLDPSLHPERAKFFNDLSKVVAVDASTGDWVEPYSRALIVVNQVVGGDLNFRYFEALAAGALLITPRLYNGFSDLFIEGEDFVSYQPGSVSDAGEKIAYFLEHPEEALKIAASGRKKLLLKHTSQARANELSELLNSEFFASKNNVNLAAMLCLVPALIAHIYKLQSDNSILYLEECQRLLNCALEYDENFSDEFTRAGVLSVLLGLVELKQFEELELTARKLMERNFIDNTIGAIFVIASLLDRGRTDDAMEFASGISNEPSEFICSVPGLVAQVRESILSSI